MAARLAAGWGLPAPAGDRGGRGEEARAYKRLPSSAMAPTWTILTPPCSNLFSS